MFQTHILAVSYTLSLKGCAVIVINQEGYDHRLCRALDLVLEAELCVGSCIYTMWQLALKGGRAFIVRVNFFNWRLSGDKWFNKSNLEVCMAVCCLRIPIFLPVRSGEKEALFTMQKISNCLMWAFGESYWGMKWGECQSWLSLGRFLNPSPVEFWDM